MKKGKKIALITAGCMILAGLIMAMAGLATVRFDVFKLNTIAYETNTYEIGEPFHSISIASGASDVRFYPSELDTCRVVCTEDSAVTFEVEVKDDTLYIRRQYSAEWQLLRFGVYFGETGISVYLPEDTYESLVIHTSSGNVTVPEGIQFASAEIQGSSGGVKMLASIGDSLSIQTQSGDIRVENASPETLTVQSASGEITIADVTTKGEIHIQSTSGDVALGDVQGKSIVAATTSGEITLSKVISDGDIRLKSTSGDVELRDSDGSELSIQTSSGSVSGTLLSEKVFLIHTSSGDVDVPHSASGGKCEVSTQSGDVDFTIGPVK